MSVGKVPIHDKIDTKMYKILKYFTVIKTARNTFINYNTLVGGNNN